MQNVNFNNYMQGFLYGWLIIILVISAITDLRCRRIYNFITFPSILIALISYFLFSGVEGFLFSLSGLITGFTLLFVPYLTGVMGAGDVKLMTVVGAFIGFSQIIVACLFIAISGGIIAIFMMWKRGLIKQTFSNIIKLFSMNRDVRILKVDDSEFSQDGVPFAIAIASGVFLFFIYLMITKQTLPVLGIL